MIAEARQKVAGALSGLGIPVHQYAPSALAPPAVVVVWGDPLHSHRTSGRSVIGLEARIVVSTAGGFAPQASLDALIDAAVLALVAAGMHIDDVGAPTQDPETGTLSAAVAVYVSTERK